MLILPLVMYLINLRGQKFSRTQTSYFLLLIFTSIIYFVKNLIISGCLIFPISQTCINYLPWTNTENVQNFTQRVMTTNNAIRLNQILLVGLIIGLIAHTIIRFTLIF